MSETHKTEEQLATAPIGRLMLKLAVPTVAAQLINMLYNIVDRIYIGHIPEVGSTALTGVGVTFPIITLVSAFAAFAGQGGAPLASIRLGAGRRDEAERILGNSLILLLAASLLLTVGFSIYKKPILYAFGASDATITYGVDYIRIYLLGTVFVQLALGLNTFISAQGKALVAMLSVLIGAFLNIILDPIFIFVLDMGVTGAAVATVIGQFCGCILALIFNLKKNKEIHLQFRGFRPNWRLVGNIYAIGLPSVIMVAIGSVMTFCMNKILIAYHSAKETAATAFGIYFKLNSFIFMPVFGLNNGMVPIVAYNYGAQNRLRMVETIKRSTIYASCIMVLGVIIFWAIPGPLLKIFDATDTMLQVGVPALRIISLSFCMAGACIALGSSFQALGKAVYSMTTSIIRQLVFLVPIAYVLARYGHSIGNDDLVWWSYPLAEIASLLVTLVFFGRLYRTLIAPLPANGGAPVHDDSDDDPIGE